MALDEDTVARIARLANIEIPEAQRAPMAEELSRILTWIEQLNEVDIDGVAPMTRVVDVTLPMRDDTVTDGGIADDITANAPESERGFFLVPKVIE